MNNIDNGLAGILIPAMFYWFVPTTESREPTTFFPDPPLVTEQYLP
jgi:hypothetical protein